MRKMKDCGIDWIGQVPNDWEITRLRFTAEIVRGGSPRPIESFISDDGEGFNWVKIGDADKDNKYITHTSCKIIRSGLSKTRMVHANDLILTNSMSFGEPYIMGIDGCIHDGWVAFSKYKGIVKEFLYWCLLSDLCRIQFEKQVDGGVVQNLNIDKIGNTIVFLPPLAEQQKIADFLDEKCGEIDSIRSDIQKQIDILNDYKKSVITEAVTKGLNPKAKLKDSGIKWVGNIPAHWECKPIGIFFREICRKNIDGAVTNPLKFTYGAIVPKPDFDANSDEYVAKTILNYNVVDFGTIMINGLNLNYDLVSQRVALVQNKGIITSAYLAIKAKREIEMNPYYAMYAFKFYDYCMAFHNMGEGVRKTLGFEELKHVYFMLPPIQEQNAIVSHLDEKCSEIDAIIADKQKQLETLDEYKKSLIFEYVTGKKQVS